MFQTAQNSLKMIANSVSMANFSLSHRILTVSSVLLLSVGFCTAQIHIDSNNYFKFYSTDAHQINSGIQTIYLDKESISEVIFSEMDSLGFEWLHKFRIVEIDSGLPVISICYSEKQKVGFLFEGSHSLVPLEVNRHVKSLFKKTGYDYSEKIVGSGGESRFIRIEEVPDNLFIIKQECYWYQESENSNDELVSKEIIYEILRQDIRTVLRNWM